jgi:medium-chain acyl-[acyl-carrier-protein] hydrolase
VAYGGDEDPTVSREELEAWRAQTSASFELRLFQGGHMYLHPGSDAFFTRLAEDLLGAGAGAS